MMEVIGTAEFWYALTALTFLEIVLGIDNVVFVAVAADKLPEAQRRRARNQGIWLAMALRIAMLAGLVYLIAGGHGADAAHAAAPHESKLFGLVDLHFTLEEIVFLLGGLFLLGKGTWEIHETIEGGGHGGGASSSVGYAAVIAQILVINVVFSLDSVITAVGMTDILLAMVLAIVLSTIVMVAAASPVSTFIANHPTTKMLALSFILLIGMVLVADGFGFSIPRGYIYFAIAFSLLVEVFNILYRRNRSGPGKLREHV